MFFHEPRPNLCGPYYTVLVIHSFCPTYIILWKLKQKWETIREDTKSIAVWECIRKRILVAEAAKGILAEITAKGKV